MTQQAVRAATSVEVTSTGDGSGPTKMKSSRQIVTFGADGRMKGSAVLTTDHGDQASEAFTTTTTRYVKGDAAVASTTFGSKAEQARKELGQRWLESPIGPEKAGTSASFRDTLLLALKAAAEAGQEGTPTEVDGRAGFAYAVSEKKNSMVVIVSADEQHEFLDAKVSTPK